MAYLITCAGSKQTPAKEMVSELSQLSFNQSLRKLRENLIEATGCQLNWRKTLPAWQLYTGPRSKLYPKVSTTNWTKDCVEIKILSALFGWIKHTDLIPLYDLKMTDTVIIGNRTFPVWRYWYAQGRMNDFIDVQKDIDLLSINYRKAINGNGSPVGILPKQNFDDYGAQKGIWLNNELNQKSCD